MFSIRTAEADPRVIIKLQKRGHDAYEEREMDGIFHRVYPVDARENSALRLIEHGVDKFAPAVGNGILITDRALRKFT